MSTSIFVNLAVKDLNKSVAFFTQLGFSFNPEFTDDSATCMIVSDHIFVMLLVEERFKTFTPKDVADAKQVTEVLMGLTSESREAVDDIVTKAIAAGATTYKDAQDHGFMYSHSFQDLDGHVWEFFFMEPTAV